MSKYRTAPGSLKDPFAPPASPLQAWMRLWFTPVNPIGLHALRLLAGLLFIYWLLPFAGNIPGLFGLSGWFDTQAYYDLSKIPQQDRPQPIGWSLLYLGGSNPTLLNIAYWGSLAVLVLFTLGVATRLTAILTWVIVVSFTANPATAYDADSLLIILAFYLMIGYVFLGQWDRQQSIFARIFGPPDTWLFSRSRRAEDAPGSVAANVAVRLLQVHFAMVMVTSGLHKLQFGEWWSGAAFWYPLHPPFKTSFEQARDIPNPLTYLSLLSLGAYATLAWQIAFPLFAWRPRWRFLLLGGAVIGWLGLALMYEMPLFGPAICIGCLSYLTPGEWEWIRDLLATIPGLGILKEQPALAPTDSAKVTAKKEESFIASRPR